MQMQTVLFENFQKSHNQIDSYLNSNKDQEVIKICLQNLTKQGIPYLIYLHAYHILEDLFNNIQKKSATLRDVQLLYFVPKQICGFFFDGIVTKQDKLYQVLKKVRQKQQYRDKFRDEDEDRSINIKDSQKNNSIKNLLKDLLEVKDKLHKDQELPKLIKKVAQFRIDQDNIYQQICLNWIKHIVDRIRKDQNNICCKCFYQKNQTLIAAQNRSQQFKRYIWPIKAANIQTHIKKTIVGFLNSSGGIIYVGIYQNKQKLNSVVGISLDRTKLKEVYEFFKSLVNEVYPKHKGFQVSQQCQYHKFQGSQLRINDYVTIQFVPVVQKDEFYNVRGDKDVEKLYIIKIFVKIGYPKHFYHLINNEHSIDFYVRIDRNVQKKSFPESHSIIYERLDKFEEKKKTKKLNDERKPFHQLCQYSMEYKIQEQDLNEDSDDDLDEY